MNMDEILQINSIPVLESELKAIHENLFKVLPEEDQELITLFQKELLIRVRIKQIEQIIHS